MQKHLDNYSIFYLNYVDLNGELFTLLLDKKMAKQYLCENKPLYQPAGFWGEEIPGQIKLLADSAHIIANEKKGIAFIPCFINSNSEEKYCSRNVLARELVKISDLAPGLHFGLEFNCYVFDLDLFQLGMIKQDIELDPKPADELLEYLNSLISTEQELLNSFTVNPLTKQITFEITSEDLFDLADSFMLFKERLDQQCKHLNLYPSFMPKIDGLPPSGLSVKVEFPKNTDIKIINSASAGILEYAKPLSAVSNSQINSYKRLTPKKIVRGWNIPCYSTWSNTVDENVIVWHLKGSSNKLIVRHADSYCNVYFNLACLVASMYEGIKTQYSLSDKHTNVLLKENLMPSNLGEAAIGFKQNNFAKKIFGDYLHTTISKQKSEEWAVYCDKVHPWELQRGFR